MSATEELRRLLDERGVEWMDDSYAQLWCTVWHGQDGKQWRMTENQSGMLTELKAWKATPEQAIAATLGPTDPRERGLIPHFWTGDWTLHVDTERLPERIDVTLPDQRGREVYSARVHRFVPERTCRYEPDYTGFTWWDENDVEHYEEDSASDECWSASCNKCGFTMIVGDEGWFNGWDDIKVWTDEDDTEHHGILLEPIFKFCPNCGAKVVGE